MVPTSPLHTCFTPTLHSRCRHTMTQPGPDLLCLFQRQIVQPGSQMPIAMSRLATGASAAACQPTNARCMLGIAGPATQSVAGPVARACMLGATKPAVWMAIVARMIVFRAEVAANHRRGFAVVKCQVSITHLLTHSLTHTLTLSLNLIHPAPLADAFVPSIILARSRSRSRSRSL